MTNTELGERLRIIRLYRRWTQAQLAAAIHARQSKVSNLEKGISAATLCDMGRMAQALHFSLDAFYNSEPFDLKACLLPWPKDPEPPAPKAA